MTLFSLVFVSFLKPFDAAASSQPPATSPDLPAATTALTLTITADDNDGRGSRISGDIVSATGTHFILGAGSSRQKGASPEEATSREFEIGVGMDPERAFNMMVLLNSWGLKDELEHNTVSITFQYQTRHWIFGLGVGAGAIRFSTNTQRVREFKVEDRSVSVNLGYRGFGGWQFALFAEDHSFSEDLGQLSSDRVAAYFSDSTLTLASGIVDSRSALRIGYSFTRLDVHFEGGQSISAFDQAKTTFTALTSDLLLNDQWSLSASLGSSRTRSTVTTDDDEPVGYMSLGGTYLF